MRLDYKYFYITEVGASPSGKTKIYHVVNQVQGIVIATIKWYAQWRQYTFEPKANTVWSAGCLLTVQNFLIALKKGGGK